MDADSRKFAGCTTCGIEAFKNKQEQFEHSFSLKHHTKIDEQTASFNSQKATTIKWYHICELCKLKVGPLTNFAVHVNGRKHRRAIELYKESIVGKEARASSRVVKKKASASKKGAAKVIPKGSRKETISKGRQQVSKPHTNPKEPVKSSAATGKKSNIGQPIDDCQRNLRSNSRAAADEKSTDPEGEGLDTGEKARLGENVRLSEEQPQANPKKKTSSEPAAKWEGDDECNGDEDAWGEGDDEEMNRNWNGGGYPPRFPMGGPPPYRGRGGRMGFHGGRGNMSAWCGPPFGPFNGPRPFNRYSRRSPEEGPSPWENDGYGYGYNGNWQDSTQWNFYEDHITAWHDTDDDDREGRKGSSHHPSENASQSGTAAITEPSSKESSEKMAVATRQGQSGSSKAGGASSNGSRPSTPLKSCLKSSATTASGTSEQSSKSKGSSGPVKSSLKSGAPGREPPAVGKVGGGVSSNGSGPLSKSSVKSVVTVVSSRSSEQSGSSKGSWPLKSSLKSATPARAPPTVRKGEASAKVAGTTAAKSVAKKPPLLPTPSKTATTTTGKTTAKTTGPGPPATMSKAATGGLKTSGNTLLKVTAPAKTPEERAKVSGPVAAKASAPNCSKVSDTAKPPRSSVSPSLATVRAGAQVKMEVTNETESAEEDAAAAQPSSSGRSHLIFLSSEDDEKDEPAARMQPRRKSRPEGNASVETAKKGRGVAMATAPLPCSPDREVHTKKGPLLKSPKLGHMTSKDMFRKDVLEKLINFPSSPQVQAQLNKWMLEMRKYQRSISARNTLRLCSTQARLEHEEDLLGNIPSIDFDVLVRQVESCELPEEMLKSLMQALNTDMEPSLLSTTTADVPSSTTAGTAATSTSGSSKAGSTLSSSSTKIDATKEKADTFSAKISEPTKGSGLKRKSPSMATKSVTKAAEKDSSSSSSSSDDECVVLPTPKKPTVTVNLIDSDDEEVESSTDEEEEEGDVKQEEEEEGDVKPTTTTASKPSGKQVTPGNKPVAPQGNVSMTEKSSTLASSTRTTKEVATCVKESPKTPLRGAKTCRERKQSVFPSVGLGPDGDASAPARRRGRPRKSEAEKAEAKARHAEAMRVRRRENPEMRAREAAAKRLRRIENPEYRAREAEAMRRKRAEQAEHRAREANNMQRKRSENPEYPVREVAMKHQRQSEDTELHAHETEVKRQQQLDDPALRATEAEARCLRRRAEGEQQAREKLVQHASSTTRDDEDDQPEARQARPSRLRSRPSESACDSANLAASVSSSSQQAETGESEPVQLAPGDPQRPASRTKSATPTGSVGMATSTRGAAPAATPPGVPNVLPPTGQGGPFLASAAPLLTAPAGTSGPPPNVRPPSSTIILKTEQSSPPPAQGTTPPSFSGTPPTLAGGGTPPMPSAFKGLVDDLMMRCRQEDAIRHELVQVEQGIASAMAALEELKKRREELFAKEAQARKERLDILQCLQGAASALQATGQPVLHFTLPAQSVAATEMLSSFGGGRGGGTDMVFNIGQVPPGVPTNVAGQTPQAAGMFPQASTPTAQEIAQLLLPHMQQFGDIDVNSLAATMASATATTTALSTSLPTMSPEVSGGPSSRRPTAKRKSTKDGEPTTATRKRPKASRAEFDGDIDDLQMDQIPPCLEISAHDSAIVALKLHGHYIYSCSNDFSARRHDLLDASQCVKYLGSTKTVNSIEVHNGKGQSPVLYTASLDGNLRSYNAETGDCTNTFTAESPIICTAIAWGKIYLGLQSGYVSVFNLKSQKFQDQFYCSNASVSRITTTTEGAQKLLCTVTFDGSITIRDPSTGLLFRCLEGIVQPPSCIAINNGFVYTSSTDRTIRIHELRTGCLNKVYESKSAATGMRFQKGLLVCCSFDGLIRCYRTKDFSCEVVYYGAGKNMVMSLDVNGPLIATGNRKGRVEVIKFDKSSVQACEIRPCNLKFAREEDLVHHLKREHIGLGGKGSMTCPWNQCHMSFSGPNCSKDFEKHLMDHACT